MLGSSLALAGPNPNQFAFVDNLRHYAASFLQHGHYKWHVTVARKPVVGIIYPGDLDQFASWDTSIVWDQFPGQTDVLTVHGLKDATVPP